MLFSCDLSIDTFFPGREKISVSKGSYYITGVVNDLSGNPVKDVRVNLSGYSVYSTKTDNDGRFTFNDLNEANYKIEGLSTSGLIVPDEMSSSFALNGNIDDYNLTLFEYESNESFININQIQGKSHISPYNGKRVTNVIGVVTAFKKAIDDYPTFEHKYMNIVIQSPFTDNDIDTSEAIKIITENSINDVKTGDLIIVKEGVVKEIDKPLEEPFDTDGGLSLTHLVCRTDSIVTLSSGNKLPEAVVIGDDGRLIPEVTYKDVYDNNVNHEKTIFNSTDNALDFYESMEFMRVTVNKSYITAPKAFEEICIVPENNNLYEKYKSSGGGSILKNYQHFNPFIIRVTEYQSGFNLPSANSIKVGYRFDTPITGIMDYYMGMQSIRITADVENPVVTKEVNQEITNLHPSANMLTIGGFNLKNLTIQKYDTSSTEKKKFEGIAEHIAINLGSPDILGLVEIQDDNGETQDGLVSCAKTMSKLIELIHGFTSPSVEYKYAQIDPEYGKDGGAPGANIRVVLLYNANRVTFVSRPGGSSIEDTAVVKVDNKAYLTSSPGKFGVTSDAFKSTRKSLIGEFLFKDEKIFVIINHLSSKMGDGPPFGVYQPPVFGSQVYRHKQAKVVNDFVKKILSIEPDANIVMVGDYNDYQFSQTMNIIKGNELINLVDLLPENERYTYIHNGISQTLDHILVSKNMYKKNATLDVVRLYREHSDDDDVTFSDHEPLISGYYFGNDTEKPEVSSILSPASGSIAASNMELQIEFNKSISLLTSGKVVLSGGNELTLTTDNAVFTVNNTILNVKPDDLITPGIIFDGIYVEGFSDTAGNIMTPYTDESFTLTIGNSDVKIYAVAPRGPGGAYDELVILYNAGDASENLNGWKIMYSTDNKQPNVDSFTVKYEFTEDYNLNPGKYVLVASNGYVPAGWNGNTTADFTRDSNFVFKDGDGHIYLDSGAKTPGSIVDIIGYGSSSGDQPLWPEGTYYDYDSPGALIYRNDPGVDTDNNANDFTENSVSGGVLKNSTD